LLAQALASKRHPIKDVNVLARTFRATPYQATSPVWFAFGQRERRPTARAGPFSEPDAIYVD